MRKRIELAVKAYHNHLTQDWMDSQSTETLLAYCHPIDRKDFREELSKQ